jgi:hypothetical protein
MNKYWMMEQVLSVAVVHYGRSEVLAMAYYLDSF